MSESLYLSGKVSKRTLAAFNGPPPPDAEPLRRLLLPQGELAQFHDGREPIHYLAFIELKEGTVRGNHFHQVKEEYIYIIQGELQLIVEDIQSKVREMIPMQAGEHAFIQPGIAHTLRVLKSGQAIEFSKAHFDATDIHRYPLT